LTEVDVRGSNAFLDNLYQHRRPQLGCVTSADCGAGIGRVAKYLLLPRFDHVDLIEQSPRLLESSREYIGPDSVRTTCLTLGLQVMFFCMVLC
jgi:protein N-terminal methyltransferase